jgi:predicted Zn-dependent peptidase
MARGCVMAVCILATGWSALATDTAYQTFYPNGLELVALQDGARPMAAVMAVVGAGLRTESFGTNGASHFVEHALFNGTESLTQEQLYEEIDLIGGYCNAATREECTLYFLLVPPESIARGVWLLDQMLYHSLLPQAKVEKERGIILSEIRQDRSSDRTRATEALKAWLYRGTPYAMPILGTETGVASIPRELLVSYSETWYVPNNTRLILMGSFSLTDAVAAVETTFAREQPREIPPTARCVFPSPEGRVSLAAPVDRARAYVVAETPVPCQEAYPVCEILVEVLRLRAGRLGHAAPNIEWDTTGPSGRLLVSTPGDGEQAQDEMLAPLRALLEEMTATPATEEEVAAVKERLRADELFLREKIHFFIIQRHNELWTCGPTYALGRRERLGGVTAEAVRTLAEKLCDPAALGEVLIVAPSSGEPQVRTETADTTAAGAAMRIRTEPESPLFGLHILFRDRSLWEQGELNGAVELLHRLVAAGPDTIDTGLRWAALGAQVTFCDNPYFSHDDLYLSPRYSYIRLELPEESWREGVEFLSECLRSPRITASSLSLAKEELAAALTHQDRDARYLVRRLFLADLLDGHPAGRPVLGVEESVKTVTTEELTQFHQSYMNRSNSVVTVVGPVSPNDVACALASLLPEGPAGSPGAWPPLPETLTDLSRSDTLGTGRAYVIWGYVIGRVPRDERPALQLAVSSLSTALVQQVREERGLAYGVGASLVWLGDEAWLQVEVGTRPDAADSVVSVIRTTVGSHRQRQFSRREVRRESEKRKGRYLLRSLSRVGQAYHLGLQLLEGRHPLEGEAEVSPAEMARAARDYLKVSPAVTVVVR